MKIVPRSWCIDRMEIFIEHCCNIAISRGVFACNLVSGMLEFVLETDLGIVPVFELILKTDQKRFGLTRRVFPKDEKNNFLLYLINFLTSVLRWLNFALRYSVPRLRNLFRAGCLFTNLM
jgi:hypothetical protein